MRVEKVAKALALFIGLFALNTAHSADYYWISASNQAWSSTTAWSNVSGGAPIGTAPGAGDRVFFDGGGTGDCTLMSNLSIANIYADGYMGTLDLLSNDLSVSGPSIIHMEDISVTGTSGRLELNSATTVRLRDWVCEVELEVAAPQVLFHGGIYREAVDAYTYGTSNSNGEGGCIFESDFTLLQEGNGWLVMGRLRPDIFQSTCEFTNRSTSRLRLAYQAAGTEYQDDIVLNNVGGGIWFGEAGGAATLQNTGDILIGAEGFTSGELRFKRFTQANPAQSQAIVLTDSAMLRMQELSVFQADLVVESPRVILDRAQFNGTSSFTKTGARGDASPGGCTFAGDVTLVNRGEGNLTLENTYPDQFQANLSLENRSEHNIILGNRAIGTIIAGDLSLSAYENIGTSYIYVTNIDTATVQVGGNINVNMAATAGRVHARLAESGELVCNGDLNIVNDNTAEHSRVIVANTATARFEALGNCSILNKGPNAIKDIYLGNNGQVVIRGDLDILNSSDAVESRIRLADNATAELRIIGDITIEVDEPDSRGLGFGYDMGHTILSGSSNLTVTAFEGYELMMRNITSTMAGPISISASDDSRLVIDRNDIANDLTCSSGRLWFHRNTVGGNVQLTKTSGGNDHSAGGSFIGGDFTLRHQGLSNFLMGDALADSIMGNLNLENTSRGILYASHKSPGYYVKGNCTILHTDIGYQTRLANATASSMHIGGDLSINSQNTDMSTHILIANQGDILVEGDVEVNNQGTPTTGDVSIAYNPNSSVEIGGGLNLLNTGTGARKRIYLGFRGDLEVDGPVSMVNNSTANTSDIIIAQRTESLVQFNEAIDITVTEPLCSGVFFGLQMGRAQLSASSPVSLTTTFEGRQLLFRNVHSEYSAAQNYELSTNSLLQLDRSSWDGSISGEAGRILLHESNIDGELTLNKTSGTNDTSRGGNHISGSFNMIHSGTGNFTMSRNYPDTVLTDMSISNQGAGNCYFAYSIEDNYVGGDMDINHSNTAARTSIGTTAVASLNVGGNVTVDNQSSHNSALVYLAEHGDISIAGNLSLHNRGLGNSSAIIIADRATSSMEVGETLSATNEGAGTSKRIYLANQGSLDISDKLVLENTSTAGTSLIDIAVSATANVQCSGDVDITASAAGCDGIRFGVSGGNTTLSAASNLIVSDPSYRSNELLFRNLTHLNTAATSIDLSPQARYTVRNCTWHGPQSIKAGRLLLRETEYMDDSDFEKENGGNDASYGGNLFHGTASFTHIAGSDLSLGESAANTYMDDVAYVQTGTGRVLDGRNHSNLYHGDIYFDAINYVNLGWNTGAVSLVGTGTQTIDASPTSVTALIGELELNKPSGILDLQSTVDITRELDLTSGIVETSNAAYLDLWNDVVASNYSDDSYVEGPILKRGNDAFEFPTGADGYLRTISMSAPNTNSARFMAEYLPSDPDPLYSASSIENTILEVSSCEYWTLERVASTAAVSVTLSWDTPQSCGLANSIDSMAVAHWNGGLGMWEYFGGQAYSGNLSSGSVTSEAAVPDFSPFVLAKRRFLTPLPVELLSLQGRMTDNGALIEWETATEINNDRFEVERSHDGERWEYIGEVQGSGNSSHILHYEFYDRSAAIGDNYYRLRQVDFDGEYEYHGPVHISRLTKSNDGWTVYPNPFKDRLFIKELPLEEGRLMLSTTSGQAILEMPKAIGETSMQLSLANLQDGMYILQFTSPTRVLSQRVIKR